MQEVSVIIPNYNGMAYLEGVLSSLEQQAFQNFETILVDNGSSDGSVAFVMGNFPWVHIVELPDNFGFSRAVNEGIYASRTPYVLLLNNDTEVDKNFVGEMLAAIKRHKKAFSCSARMICYHDRDKLDDAGNYYSALGWAYARGKGKDIHSFEKEGRIFASCAGAAIYRKKVFEKIGYLMKSILHIWKILMWAIEPGLRVMTIYIARRRWYGTSEAEPAVPSTIHSRLSWRHATMCI